MRCRYSQYGKGVLRPRLPDREGDWLGFVHGRDRRAVKVKWDGLRTVYIYHVDFIEPIREPVIEPTKSDDVCEVDLSRALILRELLKIK